MPLGSVVVDVDPDPHPVMVPPLFTFQVFFQDAQLRKVFGGHDCVHVAHDVAAERLLRGHAADSGGMFQCGEEVAHHHGRRRYQIRLRDRTPPKAPANRLALKCGSHKLVAQRGSRSTWVAGQKYSHRLRCQRAIPRTIQSLSDRCSVSVLFVAWAIRRPQELRCQLRAGSAWRPVLRPPCSHECGPTAFARATR